MSKKLINRLAVYAIGVAGGALLGISLSGKGAWGYPIIAIATGLVFIFINKNDK